MPSMTPTAGDDTVDDQPSPPADPDDNADDSAGPAPGIDIAELREEIDWLDAEILRLVKRRAEVSKTIGAARMAAGGPRIVYNREIDVLARYRELGAEGRRLAMALLNLGRGPLGR
jgi:chorismate mutase